MGTGFSELRAEISRMQAAYSAQKGNEAGILLVDVFSTTLFYKIGKALKPYLEQVTPVTDPEILQEMDSLYNNMISLSPHVSLGYMVRGQFQEKCGQFDKAVESFQAAYEIECDPTHAKWPHLQENQHNAKLMIFLGQSLFHAGREEEGQRFFSGGWQMMDRIKAVSLQGNSPAPL